MTSRLVTNAAAASLIAWTATGCSPAATTGQRGPEPQFVTASAEAASRLPFSEAVRHGHTLYLSGVLGTLPGTVELAPGGITGQTRQALENIRRVVQSQGSSMDRIVKCTVFLADIAEWPAMNEVYVRFFPGHKPARSALAAAGLALDARVEIECIAAIP